MTYWDFRGLSDFGRFSDDFRRISHKTNCFRKLVKTVEWKTFQRYALRVSQCHQYRNSHASPQRNAISGTTAHLHFWPPIYIFSEARTIFGEFREIDRFSDRDKHTETVENPRVRFYCHQDSYYVAQLIPMTVVVWLSRKFAFAMYFWYFWQDE